ncbi:hypothetical protein [Phenylobacterium sp.]|uniref:hypothetical protein n=1 Tax=Phenylobacterium sp. TaxID=1871053 RepID=UPI00289C6BB4|nr:hypothetical protein [Phenylobacterium sp.]
MPSRRSIATAIVLGGIVAATLDLGAAMLISGASLPSILQFISSGLLGQAAFSGGTATVLLGAALQEAMGLIIAMVFVLASLALPWLRRRWAAAGLAYGVVIYGVMNYVVMPLSGVGRVPKFSIEGLVKNGLAMLAFGLIVAWFAQRHVRDAEPEPQPRD